MAPPAVPAERSVHAWVRWHSLRTPDAWALLTPTVRLSYAQLWNRAETLAGDLRARGVQRGDRIVAALPNSVAMVVLDLAIGIVGGTSVPLGRSWPPATVGRILRDAGARFLAVPDREVPRFAATIAGAHLEGGWIVGPGQYADVAQTAIGGRWGTIALDGSIASTDAFALPGGDGDDRATALVMYTSGSTGEPRGVLQTVRNIDANSRSIVAFLGLTSEDRAMLTLPLSYCYGRSVLQSHLLVGGAVVLDDRFAFPRTVMEHMIETACTGFAGVPVTFEVLRRQVDIERMAFPDLRYLTQAGGAMAQATTAWVRKAFSPAQLYLMYGQTEATARLSYLPPDRAHDKEGSIGVPIEGVELRVVDDAGITVPDGTVGNLIARGDNVTPGYLDDPEATRSILREGWLWTGDLASRDSDGFYFHRGRASDLMKVGGHRVSPGEIEHVIRGYPGVRDVAVVGAPDAVLGEVPVAFIEVAGEAIDRAALRRFCAARLTVDRMPRDLIVGALPRGDAGKVLRDELRRLAASRASGSAPGPRRP